MDKLKQSIENEKPIIDYDKDEFDAAMRPIGNAILNHSINNKKVGRPSKDEKAKWDDKITCKLCNKTYYRSNAYKHKQTKLHQQMEKLNQKFVTFINGAK